MSKDVMLLPCPFCGGEAQLSRDFQAVMLKLGEKATDEHYYFQLTHKCPSGLATSLHFTRKNIILDAWNTRVPDHAARADRAEAALREARECLTDTCAAMEYWAGCDESVTPDIATSEIMSAGGAFPAHAYDEARAALAALEPKP